MLTPVPKGADPQPGPAEQDEQRARAPARPGRSHAGRLGLLLGEARYAKIGGKQPGDPAADADREQCRRDDRSHIPACQPGRGQGAGIAAGGSAGMAPGGATGAAQVGVTGAAQVGVTGDAAGGVMGIAGCWATGPAGAGRP